MNCQDIRIHLTAFAYDELDKETRSVVDEHLSHCERCRTEADRLTRTVRLLDETANQDGCDNGVLPAQVNVARITQRARDQSRSRQRRAVRWTALAALIALMVTAANLLSVHIELNGDHLKIGWGDPPAAAPQVSDEQVDNDAPALLAEHEARLDDLDNLIHLLVQSTAADERTRTRDRRLLAQQIESLRQQNDNRWRSLVVAMRSLHPPRLEPTSIQQAN